MTPDFRRAERSLRAARTLLADGLFGESVSRAYYAAFHAARAALETVDGWAKTHAGVLRLFSEHFVESGRVPSATARLLRRLHDARTRADYAQSDVEPADAAEALVDAARFVAAVADVLGAPAPAPSRPAVPDGLTPDQKRDLVAQLTREMDAASEALAFEKAAELRDAIAQIEADLAA